MLDTTSVAQAPAAPRKPSKLMADLSAAIRATADAARGEALAKVDADVATVVADIRAGSKEGTVALKKASAEWAERLKARPAQQSQ